MQDLVFTIVIYAYNVWVAQLTNDGIIVLILWRKGKNCIIAIDFQAGNGVFPLSYKLILFI